MQAIICEMMIDELNKRENEKLAKDENYAEYWCNYSIVDDEIAIE